MTEFAPHGSVCFPCKRKSSEARRERRRIIGALGVKEWKRIHKERVNAYQVIYYKAKKLGMKPAELRAIVEWWDGYKEKRNGR